MSAFPHAPVPGYPSAAPMPGYPSAAPMPGYPSAAPMPGYPSAAPYGITQQKLEIYPHSQSQQPQPPYAPVPAGGQGASAPPLDFLQKLPGYENVTCNNVILTPPAVPDWTAKPPPERNALSNLPHFTDDDVLEAVARFASEHCCYGSKPARKMKIMDITMSSAFHYTLETFGEKRTTAFRYVPYAGQIIDGPVNGPAPAAWDIMVLPEKYFQDSKAIKEVPHTAFVKPCHVCIGNGRIRCESCSGSGQKSCSVCKGSGKRRTEFNEYMSCTLCNSSGHVRCDTCTGTGQVKCKTCDGYGSLKGFVELTVTWKNHVGDYISETPAMPKELIREVSGQVVLEEQMPMVFPINHSADRLVNKASNNLVKKHNSAFPNERILQQHQILEIVPIAHCTYTWEKTSGSFCVFGFEQKVYFPDYPEKCCCGCIIL